MFEEMSKNPYHLFQVWASYTTLYGNSVENMNDVQLYDKAKVSWIYEGLRDYEHNNKIITKPRLSIFAVDTPARVVPKLEEERNQQHPDGFYASFLQMCPKPLLTKLSII